jgi:hypothetical protein
MRQERSDRAHGKPFRPTGLLRSKTMRTIAWIIHAIMQ